MGPSARWRERVWLLRDQRLVSVNDKNGPAVYVLDAKAEHDAMKAKPVATSKNTPTRKLDDFETRALTHLRDGNEVALQSSATEMRGLGAIRRNSSASNATRRRPAISSARSATRLRCNPMRRPKPIV